MKLVSNNTKLEVIRDTPTNIGGGRSRLFPERFHGEIVIQFEPQEVAKMGKSKYDYRDWMEQAAEKRANEELLASYDYKPGGVGFKSQIKGNTVVVTPFVNDEDKFDLSRNYGRAGESLSLKSIMKKAMRLME